MTLRVTLEIVPHGDESLKRIIGVLNISNQGTIDLTCDRGIVCEYSVKADGIVDAVGKRGGYFNHNRADGALVCVYKAIEELLT